jgi:hypothetical protein
MPARSNVIPQEQAKKRDGMTVALSQGKTVRRTKGTTTFATPSAPHTRSDDNGRIPDDDPWTATRLLARFAVENPKYREALINDPKKVLEKQLGHDLGKLTVKSVIETSDTMYVVVPYVQKEGELSDADLENVAGGMLNNLMAKCEIKGGLNLLSSNVNIELG